MRISDFGDFVYVPALLPNMPELNAYEFLSSADKEHILPIFEIAKIDQESRMEDAVAAIRKAAANRPFLIDLNKTCAPDPYVPQKQPRDEKKDAERVRRQAESQREYNRRLAELLNPARGFEAWRNLVAEFPAAIPIIQYSDLSAQRLQVLRQAAYFARAGKVGLRLFYPFDEVSVSLAEDVIALFENPSDLLLILDCGQSRLKTLERALAARSAVERIQKTIDLREQPMLRAVCLSGSFRDPNEHGPKQIPILDRKLWLQASESFPFIYGDYASSTRKGPSTFIPSTWIATVFLATKRNWLTYRCENQADPSGWIQGAKHLLAKYADQVPSCWGGELIRKAANDDISNANAPRFWRSARINTHLHVQANYNADDHET